LVSPGVKPVSRQWVCFLIHAEELEAIRPGHEWLVSVASIKRHLSAHGPYHADTERAPKDL